MEIGDILSTENKDLIKKLTFCRERESVASLLGKAPPIPALSLLIRDGHGLAGPMLTEAAIGQRLKNAEINMQKIF
jgi:hypothetical protein